MSELIDAEDLPPPPPPELDEATLAEISDDDDDDTTPGSSPSPSPPPPPPSTRASTQENAPTSLPSLPSTTDATSTSISDSDDDDDDDPSQLAPPLPSSVPSSPSSANASRTSSSVSQLTAKLQSSMLKQPVSGSSIPECDSDSDDDDRPVIIRMPTIVPASPNSSSSSANATPTMVAKKMSTASSTSFTSAPTNMKWEVEKANRYGLKDKRLLVLDLTGHAIRFFDGTKLKTEVPLNQIATAQRRNKTEEPKWIQMTFKEDRRAYDLYFKSDDEAFEFEKLVSVELDSSIPVTRGFSQSVHRSISGVPVSPHSGNFSSHHHHNSLSSNSSFPIGREASESVAIHTEVGGGVIKGMPSDPSVLMEDHNAYLDYVIFKKNRYGMKQQRILVINAHGCTMLLLDEKRKFKKEFNLSSILSLEIPKPTAKDSKNVNAEAQCFIVFAKETNQKPFHLFFADSLDRLHFCERLVSLAPHDLSIKDESDSVEDEDSFRFGILKLNKVGVKKKRIVVLRTKERVLRSFNREKSYKDMSFEKIIKWEKPLVDRFRVNVFVHERPHPIILIFSDPIARERFVSQCNYIRQMMEEEQAAITPPPSLPSANESPATSPATNSTTPSSVAASSASSPPPLTIFVGSWNLGNSPWAGEDLHAFIPPMKYDLYVIGLQECSKGHRDQWLLELRNHIQQSGTTSANSPATGENDAASPSSSDDGPAEADDARQPYALLGVVKLWEIVMMVLIRRPLISRVTNLCMDTVASGIADVMGNKGGCGISFTYQDSNLCFIACHLAARSERIVQRAENYMKILKQLQLGQPNVDILSQMDHVFWLGDLNYRNELEFSEVINLVKLKDWKLLTSYDQLLSQMQKQLVFAGFEEGLVRFPPTYRWDRKENQFSNKKFQAPSWTDRVLWHSLSGLADLKLDRYDSAPNVMGSDHRPIFACFTLIPRPAYTGKLTKSVPQSVYTSNPPNPNLISPENLAFALPSASLASPAATSAANSNSSSSAVTRTVAGTIGSGVAPLGPQLAAKNSLLLVPGASPQPYQHYSTLTAPTPSVSVISRPSAAGGSGGYSTGTLSSKGFTPYIFHPPPRGALFTPPAPMPALLSERAPLLGSTREFSIVLQQVKCILSNLPRGDFTLTASAPFLQTWPTTTAVSYPFGVEVGCHWEEIVLPPFIHDLYYLFTRHLLFSISVPSLAASTNGVNVEQTGVGTCIGTVTVSLATVTAAIFQLIESLNKTAAAAQPAAKSTQSQTPVQFNPFLPILPTPSTSSPSPSTLAKPINPNSPGLTGDQGSHYFIEPIYREGLYAGQMEGRLLFRYK